MVTAAQRHGELVARLAAKRPGLRKAQVMGIARLAAADQARLPGDEFEMLLVADAPRFGECEGAFVDAIDRFSCGAATACVAGPSGPAVSPSFPTERHEERRHPRCRPLQRRHFGYGTPPPRARRRLRSSCSLPP